MKSTGREARAFILYTGVIILMSSRLFLSRQPATSSPFSVAELDSVTFTITKSPTRCVPRSNTTTRFCSVRPNNWSRLRLETPSPAPRTSCHATGIRLGRETVLQGDDFIQTANLHLLGHIVRQMLGSMRTGAFAVLEHEGGIVSRTPPSARGKAGGPPPSHYGNRRIYP